MCFFDFCPDFCMQMYYPGYFIDIVLVTEQYAAISYVKLILYGSFIRMTHRQFSQMGKNSGKLWRLQLNTEEQWNSELAKLASKLYCLTGMSEQAQLDKGTKNYHTHPDSFSWVQICQ